MVLLIITLFSVLLALIILVILLYLMMSLRGKLDKLLDHENRGSRDTESGGSKRKQRSVSKSSSSSGCCNKPDPLEVVTRVPSPMSVRKRLQRISGKMHMRPRQSSCTSCTAKEHHVTHQPVPSSPQDDAILQSTAPTMDESHAQNSEPNFQRDNFLGQQQEVLSKSISWPGSGEDVSSRLPSKHDQMHERHAASFGARDNSVMMAHSNTELPKRFFHTVSSGFSSGSTMKADADFGTEIREKPPSYVNKDEIKLNELLRKQSGDNRTVNDQRL